MYSLAHSNASSLSIRYGTYNYHEGETIPVKQCHLHPNFEMINMFDDIAVVEMNDTIPLNNNNSDIVEFVSLGQQEPAAGVTVIVSGWGDVGADKGESSQLLWTSLVVSDRSKCKHKWRQSYEVTDKVLCAKATAKAGSFCHGDSGWCEQFVVVDDDVDLLPPNPGGPLTLSNGTQVGIVSITFPDCSAADHPNLFTNVWRYQQFIERIIHTHSHEY